MSAQRYKYGALDDQRGFLNSGEDSLNFQHLEEITRNSIAAIKIDCQILRKLAKNLATRKDNAQLIESIQDREKKIKENLKIILTHLTTMTSMTRGIGDRKKWERGTVLQLKNEFNAVLGQFENTAEDVKRKLERSIMVQQEQDNNVGGHNPFDEDGHDIHQQMRMKYDAQAVQERHEAIQSLERDIQDLRTIMTDIANLIADQGEVVDVLEDRVSRATENTHIAGQQLSKAKVYQSAARKKMYWIVCIISSITGCILLTIILIIVIIVVVLSKN